MDKKNGTPPAIIQEMLPFAIYAAIPIIITIFIAFTFGSLHGQH